MSQDLFASGRLRVGLNPQDNDGPRVRVVSETDTDGNVFLEQYSGDATSPTMNFRKARGTLAAPANVIEGDRIVDIIGSPKSSTFQTAGYIRSFVDAPVVSGQRPATRWEFATNPNNASDVLRVVIKSDGNVGIGIFNPSAGENPSATLHLLGEGAGDLHLHIEKATGAGNDPGLLEFFRSRGSVAARADVQDGDVLGRVSGFGMSTTYLETAKQEIAVDGAVTAGQRPPSRIDFYTNPDNAAQVRAYSVRANQRLHVGPELTAIALNAASIAQFDGHVFGTENANHIWVVRASTSNCTDLKSARARGTLAAPANVVDGDRTMRLEGWAYSGVTGYWAGAKMEFHVDGAVTDNQRPGTRITLSTNPENGAVAERLRITPAGKVGIGVTPDADKLLHVEISQTATSFFLLRNTANAANAHGGMIQAGSNTTAGSDFLAFFRPDGTFMGAINQNSATTVAYNTSSDARLKENIRDFEGGLGLVKALRPRVFSYRADAEKREMRGLIAQEVFQVLPEVVTVRGGGDCACNLEEGPHEKDCCFYAPWGIDYGRLSTVLIKAIQEIAAHVGL